jgi:hypothetical protein
MDIEQFKEKYAAFKDAAKIEITCNHPEHIGGPITIGKQPARRNILKNNGECFICRECYMHHNNPMNNKGEKRQTDEIIFVICPHPLHNGDISRDMKKTSYYGSMQQPYLQVCGSCAQYGKTISDEQREAISKTLTGRKLSAEHVEKILAWRKEHPEWAEKTKQNLVPGAGGGWNEGINMPEETKQKISEAHLGKIFTDEHCENISEGRKKMLVETGGFTREHRENISKATIEQYKKGFEPKLHHVTGWHESPKAGRVFFRSSYEKKAFLKLDSDETIKTYFCEKIETKFFNPVKKITSSYLIDLFVEYNDGSKKLVEIKPESWLEDEVVKAKILAGELFASSMNVPFEVWTEMHLFGHVYNKKNMNSFIEKIKKKEV